MSRHFRAYLKVSLHLLKTFRWSLKVFTIFIKVIRWCICGVSPYLFIFSIQKRGQKQAFHVVGTLTWLYVNESLWNCCTRCHTTKGSLGLTLDVLTWTDRNEGPETSNFQIITRVKDLWVCTYCAIPQKGGWDWFWGLQLELDINKRSKKGTMQFWSNFFSCVKYLITINFQSCIKLKWCIHTCPKCSGFNLSPAKYFIGLFMVPTVLRNKELKRSIS